VRHCSDGNNGTQRVCGRAADGSAFNNFFLAFAAHDRPASACTFTRPFSGFSELMHATKKAPATMLTRGVETRQQKQFI
jgi:hypothetical protein